MNTKNVELDNEDKSKAWDLAFKILGWGVGGVAILGGIIIAIIFGVMDNSNTGIVFGIPAMCFGVGIISLIIQGILENSRHKLEFNKSWTEVNVSLTTITEALEQINTKLSVIEATLENHEKRIEALETVRSIVKISSASGEF